MYNLFYNFIYLLIVQLTLVGKYLLNAYMNTSLQMDVALHLYHRS